MAETFIDEIETLLNRDLPEEERIPLIEKFRKMYETMDFYVLYNRFLKKEGYQTLAASRSVTSRSNTGIPCRSNSSRSVTPMRFAAYDAISTVFR